MRERCSIFSGVLALAISSFGCAGGPATDADRAGNRTGDATETHVTNPSSIVTASGATSSGAPASSASSGAMVLPARGLREIVRRSPLASYDEVGVTAALRVGNGILALGWYRGVGKGALPGAIGFDMFASRMDDAGNETATVNLGGAVIVDATTRGDDVLTAGEVFGPFAVGPVGGKPLGSIDAKVLSAVVARYDAAANGSWLVVPDTQDVEHARAVAAAPNGDVILAGQFFGHGRPGTQQLSTLGGGDGFVMRISGAGKPLHRTGFGTKTDDDVLGMAVDRDGAVYVAGVANTFAGITYANASGFDAAKPSHVLLAKIDTGGKIVWQKEIGGDVHAGATAIAAHPKGGVVVGGFTRGALPELGVDPKGAAHALFVVRVDASGAPSEARVIAAPERCSMPRSATTYPRFLPALRGGGLEAQSFMVTGSPFAPTDLAVTSEGVVGVVGVDTCGGPAPGAPRDGFVAVIDAKGGVSRIAAKAPRSIEALPSGKWLVADGRDVVIVGP